MEQIEYKTMNVDDIEVALSFLDNIQGIHLHQNGEDSVEGLTTYLNRNPGLSFIAMSNEKVVGVIFCGHDGRRGFINHLAVAKEYRHKGVASKLINMVEICLTEIGINKEALFVLKENEAAISFYETIGWKEESIVKIYSKII